MGGCCSAPKTHHQTHKISPAASPKAQFEISQYEAGNRVTVAPAGSPAGAASSAAAAGGDAAAPAGFAYGPVFIAKSG